jgi:cytidyltransferase-like protein
VSVGYLANSFDLINVRDLDLIEQASSRCEQLVVGVFSDDYAEQLLGRRPVVPLGERVMLVQHIRGVSSVVVHEESSLVNELGVTLFTVAGDIPLRHHGETTVLVPTRETESEILREALRPVRHEEVA